MRIQLSAFKLEMEVSKDVATKDIEFFLSKDSGLT